MSLTDEDLQLDNNLNELYSEIHYMLESGENENADENGEDAASGIDNSILIKLEQNVHNLHLVASARHNVNCSRASSKGFRALVGSRNTKSRSSQNGAGKSLVSRQKQQQLRKENMWNQGRASEQFTVGGLRLIGIFGDCQVRNNVFRILDLFSSLHEHINVDLACMPENFLPSDYLFDMPKKRTMPKTLNIRHQTFVLSNKIERFLLNQRSILETNRHFDFVKYTECDNMLNGAMAWLANLKQFTVVEMRHRSWEFVNNTAKSNAQQLEILLWNLREWLKPAHLFVHVFNWEMDLQYRYSGAMTRSLEANNERALRVAAVELQAAKPRQPSAEELFISEQYQLNNVVQCAAEHDDFLNALLHTPEAYFPPEIVAMCDPPSTEPAAAAVVKTPEFDESNQIEWMGYGDIVLEAPSSPPKLNLRAHKPWKYKG